MVRQRYTLNDVLCFSTKPKSRSTVRAYYLRWRNEQQLPKRCDNPVCFYYQGALEWNGKSLEPIVDHVNGNRNDNTPKNLRLLCPNCDSQNDTRGGKNMGRIQNQTETGYEVAHRNGTRDANVFPKGLGVTASLGTGRARSIPDEDA